MPDRMITGCEFDISEMAIVTYLQGKEYGQPFTALPIFPLRAFPQGTIAYNVNTGVQSPKDLEGRKVGVRAYALERQGKPTRTMQMRTGTGGMHKKIGFDIFEHGIIKRRVTNGETEEDPEWKNGHPIIFPNILLVGSWDRSGLQIRVPVDDTHTMHYYYTVHTPGVSVPVQSGPVVYPIPMADVDETGAPPWPLLDTAPGQDMMAWWTQGPVARRELERLGVSDEGIILFRKLLEANIDKVARGEDPMNTFRDPEANACIPLQTEREHGAGGGGSIYSPLTPELRRLFEEGRAKRGSVSAGAGDD